MPPQPRVFFDFTVAEEPLGRAVFELFSDVVPKTAENFRALCTGALGISPLSHLPLHYRSSIVHRIIEGFMIQGGDFTKRTGAGGESIYGGIFEDERLEGEGSEVDKPGLLVMANRGPGTNGSQWFVTLAPASHLTGKHVYALPLFPLLRDADPGRMLRVFGRVVSGFEHIQTIGRLPVDEKDRPISPVVISHCGELELRKPVKKPSPISEGSASPPRRKSRVRDGGEEKRPKKENEKRKRDKKVREETEEELDARLEREEKERLDAARLAKLAEMKRQLEDERDRLKNSGGVVYKGRGSMRFLDPESSSVRKVPHFEPRAPDVRPRRGPINVAAAATGERWQRGPDVNRPSFDRSALDRDLDRYGTKRQKEVEGKGTGRDHDDWRAGWRRSRSKEREGRQNGGVKKRSISPARGQRRRSVSPMRRARSPEAEKQRERTPSMRPESPLRGDRSGGSGSDMMIEEDD